MFDFDEELKYYEPGLETVEETLSGDIDKDMVELMQALMNARPDPLAPKEEPEVEAEEEEAIEEEKKEP